MQVLVLSLIIFFLYLLAYRTYGRWLGRRIFELSAKRICPSEELNDGTDYVPTPCSIVFGHHFTSIAGTGPIVGPAIGVIWGWVPALLWVFFGSIFIGAVHDLGSLVLSLRNQGKSIGELAGILVGPRVRLLFMLVLVLALTLVLAVFGLVIAAVFRQFPTAIFPCLVQIPLAVGVGLWLRRWGQGLLLSSLLSLGIMYLSVFFGDISFLHGFNQTLAAMPIWVWTALLLGYCYVASVLPVWLLLQPRDFINSLQLLSVVVLLVLGLVVAAVFGASPADGGERQALEIVAPAFNLDPKGAPAIFPFLFITIACGAISGFHCLVSSGTSSKQLRTEKDASFVGFGAMLTEGFLAVLVIFACAAGLGLGLTLPDGKVLFGEAAWAQQYENWGQAQSLSATVGAFVTGAGNFLSALGISRASGIALMGVFIASFAATTMDSACRLQRYVVQEFAASFAPSEKNGNVFARALKNNHGATLFCVLAAAGIAAVPPLGLEWSLGNAGKGGLLLWPLFGATNQLVAGIAFIVIIFYVRACGKPIFFLILPTLFMLVMPAWAMGVQVFWGTSHNPSWLESENWPLVFIGVSSLLLEIWLVVEAVFLWKKTPNASEH
ncbi:MAG: carbon starvation protein A [Chthoniobacterales bacterium]